LAIVYIELGDPERLFQEIATSSDPYDVWFRQQVQDIHGMDLTQPSDEPPPQIVALGQLLEFGQVGFGL
jgi:hypothetical protein